MRANLDHLAEMSDAEVNASPASSQPHCNLIPIPLQPHPNLIRTSSQSHSVGECGGRQAEGCVPALLRLDDGQVPGKLR